MRVIAHGSHSARVYTLTKTSVPSTLLRCLELFPNSFSHRSFKSARVVWWMKVWAAERISHSHWSLLDRVAIRECVCLCSCVCVCVCVCEMYYCWSLRESVDSWTQSWPPDPDLTSLSGSDRRAEGLIGSSCWLMALLSSLGRGPRPGLVHNRTEQDGPTGAAQRDHHVQILLWYTAHLLVVFLFLKVQLSVSHSAHLTSCHSIVHSMILCK